MYILENFIFYTILAGRSDQAYAVDKSFNGRLFFLQVYPIGKIRQPKMMSARLKKVIKRINEKHLLVAKKHRLTNYVLTQVINQINII